MDSSTTNTSNNDLLKPAGNADIPLYTPLVPTLTLPAHEVEQGSLSSYPHSLPLVTDRPTNLSTFNSTILPNTNLLVEGGGPPSPNLIFEPSLRGGQGILHSTDLVGMDQEFNTTNTREGKGLRTITEEEYAD